MWLLSRKEKFAMLMVGDVHRIKRRHSIAMILVDIHALAN
jgi:hypothetical protein